MNTGHRLNQKRAIVLRLLILGAVLLGVASCATAPKREAIPPFRQGVVTADQQTSAAFADVNSFLRRQQIERAMRQPALTEELFLEGLAAADLAGWKQAFALMDSYAEKLERLLDPDQRSGAEGELIELGEKMESVGVQQLPAGISSAFTKFAGILVKLRTESDALEAIRKADPAIQEIFSAMMDAIGADPGSGVRATVNRSWAQVLARIDVEDFRRASDEKAKRDAVLRYVEALDERDAQDQLLGSLRLSLATLAKVHQELAQGHRSSAGTLVQLVQDEYEAYRKQLESIRKNREVDSTNGGPQ
jgi:hypothetical protein